MAKYIAGILILCLICAVALAAPGVHTVRIRFPGPTSDKLVPPKTLKKEIAPYPPTELRPEPVFELPEATYLPAAEPQFTYLSPQEVYGSPIAPESAYRPPYDTYESPDSTYLPPEKNDFYSAAIVNAPLTVATQFTPPRPNKAPNFHPQSATSRIVSHFNVPRPRPSGPFRPRRPQVQSQQFVYPKTYLTLPHVDRFRQFRPQSDPHQQQTNFFSRPLPSNIFGNSNNGRSGRQLPSQIFSN